MLRTLASFTQQVRELKNYVLMVELQCGSSGNRSTSGSGRSSRNRHFSDLEVSSWLELLPHVMFTQQEEELQ